MNLIGNPYAALNLQLVAFTSTLPRASHEIMNTLWQQFLDNDAGVEFRVRQLESRVQQLEQTNAVQADQIMALFNAISTLQTSGTGGTGGTGGGASVITVSFTSAATPDTASTFSANSASSGGAIVANEYAFGDGTVGSGVNVSHAYTTAGRYDVTLLARDGTGASKSVTNRHLVLPPFSRRMPAGGGGQDNYPVSASYQAAQYTDPDVGPAKLISPEQVQDIGCHLPIAFGPFAPSGAKLRLQGLSTAYPDNTQNGATVGVYVKYGSGEYQLVSNLAVTRPNNSFVDVTFDLPAGFAGGDIWIKVTPPHIDNFSFTISSAEVIFDYPAEANSPSAMNQSIAFTPRMATRTITGNNYAVFAVSVGESVTPITRDAIQFRARKPYTFSSFETYILTDATSFAYMLPANATATGAVIEGDVSITAVNGATGGGATLSATPSGGAAATHALVNGEHFSLPVNLASTKGSVDLALQTTMPALTSTAANSNQGQEADYKLTVSNLVLRVSFTTP